MVNDLRSNIVCRLSVTKEGVRRRRRAQRLAHPGMRRHDAGVTGMKLRRVTRRTLLRWVGGGAAVLGGLRAVPASAQAGDIKVGMLYPLSGSLALIGRDMRQAIDLAADIVNTPHPELAPLTLAAPAGLPKLGGRKMQLVWADAKDPATARAEASAPTPRQQP